MRPLLTSLTLALAGQILLLSVSHSQIVDFQRDVAPIFAEHCLECHASDAPKADFSVEDSEAVLGYLEAGDSENSSLWADYLLADPTEEDSLVMPPVSKGGTLPAAKLATLKLWIDEGATWPEDAVIDLSKVALDTSEQASEPIQNAGFAARLWAFQGYFHPATVHFPIGLLLIGAAATGLSFFTGKRAEDFGYYCLLLGAATAVVAAMMGWAFATEQGYGSWSKMPEPNEDATLFWHRWLGVAVAVVSVCVGLIAMFARRNPHSKLNNGWKIGLLVLAMLTAWVGHQGGELKWGEQLYADAFERLLGQ